MFTKILTADGSIKDTSNSNQKKQSQQNNCDSGENTNTKVLEFNKKLCLVYREEKDKTYLIAYGKYVIRTYEGNVVDQAAEVIESNPFEYTMMASIVMANYISKEIK